MRIVAGLTGPPFLGFVHVQKMEIPVAVTKICQGIGTSVHDKIDTMAVETYGKIVAIESHVELLLEFLMQMVSISRAMGIVARKAIALPNRSMHRLSRHN